MAFILPKWGGAMVHSDPQLTDNIDLSVPEGNVEILWHRNELNGEKAGAKGNGIAGNGTIAACTFNGTRDNLVIYDYDGNRIWTSGDMLNAVAVSSTPMVSIDEDNKVIACDNQTILMVKVNPDDYNKNEVVWKKKIPYARQGVLVPFSPTIVNDEIIILPTNGPIYAFDADTGKLLAQKYLGSDEIGGKGCFSTINSACVNGSKVYIITEYHKSTFRPRIIQNARLYAVYINPDAGNKREILTEAWYYPFRGRSQASPLFIDNTIYFDGYIPGLGLLKKPYIYAITDLGDDYEEKWKVQYPHRTWFSFSKDPRGGFWYEDLRGRKLVRFAEKNGSIIEEIQIKKIIPKGELARYYPMSCMTICDKKHPVMLISAISFWPRQYVIAIDLKKDNSIRWWIQINGWNYAGGQFTILRKDNDHCKNRVVFGTYWDGVMAIGAAD